MGFALEDYADDYVEVWPENWQAWELFASLQTQWRTAGMTGQRTGLDYNVLYRKMDRMGLAPEDYNRIEEEILVMELAALQVLARKQ